MSHVKKNVVFELFEASHNTKSPKKGQTTIFHQYSHRSLDLFMIQALGPGSCWWLSLPPCGAVLSEECGTFPVQFFSRFIIFTFRNYFPLRKILLYIWRKINFKKKVNLSCLKTNLSVYVKVYVNVKLFKIWWGRLSQYMGGPWGGLKCCWKIPVKEFIW